MIFGKKWELIPNITNNVSFELRQSCRDSIDDHALTGDYFGFRECHVKPDVLLVYDVDAEYLYLVRLGSHSELF